MILPTATGKKPWTHQQSGHLDQSDATLPIEMAATVFHDPQAVAAVGQVPAGPQSKTDGLNPFRLALLGHTA